eukprot:9957950-Alexandrium_andersonii.AAC.1
MPQMKRSSHFARRSATNGLPGTLLGQAGVGAPVLPAPARRAGLGGHAEREGEAARWGDAAAGWRLALGDLGSSATSLQSRCDTVAYHIG